MKVKLILALLLISSAVMCKDIESPYLKNDRVKLSNKIVRYYNNHGVTRKSKEFRPYVWSSLKVARMFPMYPAKNEWDRTLKFISFGAKETDFYTKNNIIVNVPGEQFGKLKVRHFTVDFGWAGVNSQNIGRSYRIAKCIQDKKEIPSSLLVDRELRNELYKYAYIPKDIKLVVPSDWILTNSYKQYRKMIREGYSVKQIKNKLRYIPKEPNSNEIDSILIYRVIIELERKYNNLSYETYHKNMYNYLRR